MNLKEVMNTRDLSSRLGVKCLVYGNSGTGKTRLCATAPSPLVISAEGGLLSLRTQNVAYIEIATFQKLLDVFAWIKSSAESRQFFTIALDSISELAEVCLKNEKTKTREPRQAYFAIQGLMTDIVRDFRDLPQRHVVVVAKEETARDETTGLMYFLPSLPGSKLGPAMPYQFDEVFRMIIHEEDGPQGQKLRTPWLRCHGDRTAVAKDRSGVLAEFEKPDLSSIFNRIMS